ncbi:MAG: hypothetical protein WBP17_07600, partial [Gemmatimonadota bacterium]
LNRTSSVLGCETITAIEQLTTISETEERLVLATGQFIGEGGCKPKPQQGLATTCKDPPEEVDPKPVGGIWSDA